MGYRIYEDLPTLSLHRSVRSAKVHMGVTEVMAGFEAQGVHFGRQKALTPAEATQLRAERAQGETLRVLMRRYGLGKTALYRYLATTAPDQAEAAD